jgi:hypothetical protein
MNKLVFPNDQYFLSDTNVYYSVRDVESPFHIVDAVVVYKSLREEFFCIWEVAFQLEEIKSETIRAWLVSEQAITEGGSFAVPTNKLSDTLLECGVSLELQKESVTNSMFRELVSLINANRLDKQAIDKGSVYPLLFKYWEAECGEQEIGEDLSYLMDSLFIFEAKEYIRKCDPFQLYGKYAEEYQEYVHEMLED